jgi:hypothetical protein
MDCARRVLVRALLDTALAHSRRVGEIGTGSFAVFHAHERQLSSRGFESRRPVDAPRHPQTRGVAVCHATHREARRSAAASRPPRARTVHCAAADADPHPR